MKSEKGEVTTPECHCVRVDQKSMATAKDRIDVEARKERLERAPFSISIFSDYFHISMMELSDVSSS